MQVIFKVAVGASLLVSVRSVTFLTPKTALFGIRAGGGDVRQEASDKELERAEKAILDGITRVEKNVQSMIDEEVDILFPLGHDHKQAVTESTKQAVSKATEQVKTQAQQLPYPYAWPSLNEREVPHEHKDHKILHAVEAAEKTLLNAIEKEVDLLFHNEKTADDNAPAEQAKHSDDNHRGRHAFYLDKKTVSKAKKTVKEGVKKAQKSLDEEQEQRRSFLAKALDSAFEDYTEYTGW